jgi:hypothetical protein
MSCEVRQLPVLCIPGPIIKGDTFDAINFTFRVDGSPVDITDAEIKLSMRVGGASPAWILSVGSGITIVNGAAGNYRIDKVQSLNVAIGRLVGQVEITLTNGDRYTDYQIEMTVQNSTT